MTTDNFSGFMRYGRGVEPQCIYCFAIIYPDEYVKHLEEKHPVEAQNRQEWLKLLNRLSNDGVINGNN